MFQLGPLGFTAPALLGALAALPVIWWMLRALPPRPREMRFPAVALMRGLTDANPLARRTPIWLMLLRMLALALAILALAGPIWRPDPARQGEGPLLIVMDAGWGAAPGWQEAQAEALRRLAGVARPVAILRGDGRDALAGEDPGDTQPDAASGLVFDAPERAAEALRAARPAAWPGGYPALPAPLLQDAPAEFDTLWFSDGMDHPGRAAWLAALRDRGAVQVIVTQRPAQALTLEGGAQPVLRSHALAQDARRPDILAIGPDPAGITRELARLTQGAPVPGAGPGATRLTPIALPPELRNRVQRFVLEDVASAGAVVLADARLSRHRLGLVGSGRREDEAQDLLTPAHYLREALREGADLIEGALDDILIARPDIIILDDVATLTPAQRAGLSDWVGQGGLLIRFAGPRMAASDDLSRDDLVPLRLRPGGRDLGGALSWGEPRGLAPFAHDGPFAGLAVPDEVRVRAQLMPEPGPDPGGGQVIASLLDGTPLVSRTTRGRGQIVLFHSSAGPGWSDLSLSGLFPQMLSRLIATAAGLDSEAAAQGTPPANSTPAPELAPSPERDLSRHWQAEEVLDGFGVLSPAEGLAPAPQEAMDRGPGPGRPAGLWRAGEHRIALNAGTTIAPASWPGAEILSAPNRRAGLSLRAPLLAAMAALMLIEMLGTAALRRGLAVLLMLILTATLPPGAGWAQSSPAHDAAEPPDPRLIAAAREVALAYLVTGDAQIDAISEAGLRGLSQALAARTSVEPGPPLAFDPEADDPSLLSLIYWPIDPGQPVLSPAAYIRLNRYLRRGGMILFDSRDGDVAALGGPDHSADLQRVASGLDIPPLAPITADHVLTRSFYLLEDFPGRHADLPLWVEAPDRAAETAPGAPFRRLNDGVSPVIIGAASWAEAWAVDQRGLPMAAIGRGYDGERQRELALRFGINLVIYALTGNYKSDQVHVPALLKRLQSETGGP